MQPVFLPKTERGIEKTLNIEVDHRPDEVQVLEGGIKEEIPVGLGIIPAGKTGHPGADIEDTEQEEQAEPFIGCCFIDHSFPEQEDRIYESVNEKDQQDRAEGIKTE